MWKDYTTEMGIFGGPTEWLTGGAELAGLANPIIAQNLIGRQQTARPLEPMLGSATICSDVPSHSLTILPVFLAVMLFQEFFLPQDLAVE